MQGASVMRIRPHQRFPPVSTVAPSLQRNIRRGYVQPQVLSRQGTQSIGRIVAEGGVRRLVTPTKRVIYLGRLPPETTENELLNLTNYYGKVVRLNFHANRHCCFVEFKTAEHALNFFDTARREDFRFRGQVVACDWAKKQPTNLQPKILQPKILQPKRLQPPPAVPSSSLFLSQLDSSWTRDELHTALSKYGEVLEIDYVPAKKLAFIHFASVEQCVQCYEHLQTQPQWAACFIDYAKPSKTRLKTLNPAKPMIVPIKMKKVPSPCLWVGNVDPDISLSAFKALFARFGEIKKVQKMPGAEDAFVIYQTTKDAIFAKEQMHGTRLGKGQLTTRIGKASRHLWVSGVRRVSPADLERHFARFGKVVGVKCVPERDGALINFEHEADALVAYEESIVRQREAKAKGITTFDIAFQWVKEEARDMNKKRRGDFWLYSKVDRQTPSRKRPHTASERGEREERRDSPKDLYRPTQPDTRHPLLPATARGAGGEIDERRREQGVFRGVGDAPDRRALKMKERDAWMRERELELRERERQIVELERARSDRARLGGARQQGHRQGEPVDDRRHLDNHAREEHPQQQQQPLRRHPQHPLDMELALQHRRHTLEQSPPRTRHPHPDHQQPQPVQRPLPHHDLDRHHQQQRQRPPYRPPVSVSMRPHSPPPSVATPSSSPPLLAHGRAQAPALARAPARASGAQAHGQNAAPARAAEQGQQLQPETARARESDRDAKGRVEAQARAQPAQTQTQTEAERPRGEASTQQHAWAHHEDAHPHEHSTPHGHGDDLHGVAAHPHAPHAEEGGEGGRGQAYGPYFAALSDAAQAALNEAVRGCAMCRVNVFTTEEFFAHYRGAAHQAVSSKIVAAGEGHPGLLEHEVVLEALLNWPPDQLDLVLLRELGPEGEEEGGGGEDGLEDPSQS